MSAIAAVLIAGPTASGKSGVALRLAERLGGVIVNADSMQVYRDLAVLTARPAAADAARAAHLLFGHVDGAIPHSVGRFLDEAAAALGYVRGERRIPIFVGGTGLYFKALTQGLSDIPAVPAAIRAEWRTRAQTLPVAALHAELAARDPVMAAKLGATDPQRILRALEVHAATGRSLASFHGGRRMPLLDMNRCIAIFLAPERAALNAAIDARFERMLTSGALDEVAALRARRLDPALPVMRALGVPALLRHLDGAIDLVTAAHLAQRDTRAYAKRQFTFARNQLPAFRWVSPDAAAAVIVAAMQRGSNATDA